MQLRYLYAKELIQRCIMKFRKVWGHRPYDVITAFVNTGGIPRHAHRLIMVTCCDGVFAIAAFFVCCMLKLLVYYEELLHHYNADKHMFLHVPHLVS